MGKKQRVVLASLLVVVLGGFAWLALRQHDQEPVYEGKPLSFWIERYDPYKHSEATTKADEAVRKLGTNSIPVLLQMMRAHDSPLKLKLIGLAQWQHVLEIPLVPASTRNLRARLGFHILRFNAKSAVPQLIEIYELNPDPQLRLGIVQVFYGIGTGAAQAIPLLLSGATNAEANLRLNAVGALGQMFIEPEVIVPALIESLKDPHPYVRANAIQGLGNFGAQAKSAVPALLESLDHPQMSDPATTRGMIENALKKIDPGAAAKAGVK